MTVREIVKKYLQKNGFDGLYNELLECGCDLNDLMCCPEDCFDCKAGYKVIITKKNQEEYEGKVGDWVITKKGGKNNK